MFANPATWAELVMIVAVGAFGSIVTLAVFSGAPPERAAMQGAVALAGVGVLGWVALRLGVSLHQQGEEQPESQPPGMTVRRQPAQPQED